LHQQHLVSISFLAAQPEAMPATAFATTPIPAAQLDAMHQPHLQLHQFQQHNWMQCINSISSFINSSSTTGCNASTALAHTLIPAAQLDHLHYLFPAAQLEQYAFPAAQLEHLHYSFPAAQLEATPATVLAAFSIPAAQLEAMPATALANSFTLAAKPEDMPAKALALAMILVANLGSFPVGAVSKGAMPTVS
jgi:hypothetical protein